MSSWRSKAARKDQREAPERGQKEEDTYILATMERIEDAGVTLNSEKCEFHRTQVKFLGHVINVKGISANSEKISAISAMQPPNNVSELLRFLGMANQLGKFSPSLAEHTQPLQELLSNKRTWSWGPDQECVFGQIKADLTSIGTVLFRHGD